MGVGGSALQLSRAIPYLFSAPLLAVGLATCLPSRAPAQEGVNDGVEGVSPESIDKVVPHENHLGMRFVPVDGTHVLFCTTETTVGVYEQFLEATGHPAPAKPHFEQSPDHPVVGVGSGDGIAFCDWLTKLEREKGLIGTKQRYRLPERREWDFAVGLVEPFAQRPALEQEIRNKTFYPWGEQWPPVGGAGNFAADQLEGYEDDFVFTAPVKSFTANAHGIYDLAGNVWEWTESDSVAGTPQWVLRGGSWIYFVPETLLASYEYRVSTGLKASSIGFRCVFEDVDSAPKLSREMIAARKAEQSEARSRFVSRTTGEGEMSEEEKSRRKQDLLEKGYAKGKEGNEKGASAMEERRRLLAKLPSESGDGKGVPAAESRVRTRPDGYVAKMGQPFENSLEMKFRPIEGTEILFGETEVRISDFTEFAKANPGQAVPSGSFKQGDDHPVIKITWSDAVAFCGWLTRSEREAGWLSDEQEYRLPTAEEWKIAAGEAEFPWGPEWPPPLRTENLDALKIKDYEDKSAYTAAVGKAPANAVGVFDLGGNVSEWCLDSWEEGGSEKVVCGGSWMTNDRERLMSAYRDRIEGASSRINIGFRCVLSNR
jgi:formylglycine-generating enzyme required for sulfatase activity